MNLTGNRRCVQAGRSSGSTHDRLKRLSPSAMVVPSTASHHNTTLQISRGDHTRIRTTACAWRVLRRNVSGIAYTIMRLLQFVEHENLEKLRENLCNRYIDLLSSFWLTTVTKSISEHLAHSYSSLTRLDPHYASLSNCNFDTDGHDTKARRTPHHCSVGLRQRYHPLWSSKSHVSESPCLRKHQAAMVTPRTSIWLILDHLQL